MATGRACTCCVEGRNPACNRSCMVGPATVPGDLDTYVNVAALVEANSQDIYVCSRHTLYAMRNVIGLLRSLNAILA